MTNEAQIEPGGDRERSLPLLVLFAPDKGMDRQAKVGGARWFFLVAWLCSLLLGAALSYRVDAHDSTLRKLDESGQLKTMSDRQIAEETKSAERVAQVGNIAKAAVATPVNLALACLSLLILCWFFRGRVKGRGVVPVAAATLLPGAMANLMDSVIAFRHVTLPPEGFLLGPRSLSAVLSLSGRSLSEPWVRFGNGLDFFSLWAAVMLGYGVSAVGQVPKKYALPGTLIAWVCVRLLTHVAIRR